MQGITCNPWGCDLVRPQRLNRAAYARNLRGVGVVGRYLANPKPNGVAHSCELPVRTCVFTLVHTYMFIGSSKEKVLRSDLRT